MSPQEGTWQKQQTAQLTCLTHNLLTGVGFISKPADNMIRYRATLCVPDVVCTS